MCADAGAILYTVEVALRDRHFEVTQANNPRHIQLRSPNEIFYKENLTNAGISRLPSDWEYVAWIDADVQFARPDWAAETVHQLQHYQVVQLFSHALDLGPNSEPLKLFNGFMAHYCQNGHPKMGNPLFEDREPNRESRYYYGDDNGKPLYHPGYAWAARRSALSDLGGLGDIAILGSGDHHMASALIGNVDKSYPRAIHQTYKQYWGIWQERAEQHIKRNVGFVPGTIIHYWHGAKANRRYVSKWAVLTENGFDSLRDIKYDVQGLWQWTGRNPKLQYAVRDYFGLRDEDSTEVK
jgi:hypothetical protein